MASIHSYQDILKTLIRSPSVVGCEHAFFRVLQRELEERGAKVTWYEGVLVAQGARPRDVMFSAHIDRHGLVCTGPAEFQYAAFVTGARTDLLGNSVTEELMLMIADRFEDMDVFAYVPWSGAYLGKGQISGSYICEHRNNLIFEVQGLDHLMAGTPVAFRDTLSYGKGAISGQLDNVISAAVLIHLFDLGFKGTAFFTAQEEAGRSWRYLLEWFRRFGGQTNQLIVLDTSPYPSGKAAACQDLVLRHKDANGDFNEALTLSLFETCDKLGVKTTYKDEYIEQQNVSLREKGKSDKSLGSTEMGRIIAASSGLVDGTTLQIPTTGYHTMEETAMVTGCEAYIEVLANLAGL